MTTTTCKERIKSELKNTMEDLDALHSLQFTGIDSLSDHDKKVLSDLDVDLSDLDEVDVYQALDSYGLHFGIDSDTRGSKLGKNFKRLINRDYHPWDAVEYSNQAVCKWTISTGGPADYFIIQYDYDGRFWRITAIDYVYQDWFDGAVMHLKTPDLETVSDLVNMMVDFESLHQPAEA